MKELSPMLAVGQVHSMLNGLDWVVITLYFGVLLCVAWWAIRRNKNTAADYFLGGRNLGWWVIGASIFASNIGSEHIVGLAGSGAKDGVALAHYELHAWCLLVLAWVFVPFYARSLVFNMPEFLERRFCPKSRYMLSIVSLVTFIVSKIAVGILLPTTANRSLLSGMPRPISSTASRPLMWRTCLTGHQLKPTMPPAPLRPVLTTIACGLMPYATSSFAAEFLNLVIAEGESAELTATA